MKITVLTGGSTAERDVAFAGAAQVVVSLRNSGHDVTVVDTVTGPMTPERESKLLKSAVSRAAPDHSSVVNWRELEEQTGALGSSDVLNADLVVIILHGEQGEGGDLQEELDNAGVRYAGSGPTGSRNAMDKDRAKSLMREASVPTPDWVMWNGRDTDVTHLGFPLIVKPSRVGSTVGLSVVRRPEDLVSAVQEALLYDKDVMCELYVSGREFTVGVLGERALAVGEIIPEHEIFDYECKYTPGMSQEIFPAPVDEKLERRLKELALEVHRALGLKHFSRIDFLVSAEGVFCLEANTLPGMTGTSLLPQSAAAEGIDFDSLCNQICSLALA